MNLDLETIRDNCDEVGDCWEWRGAYSFTAPVMRPPNARYLLPVRRVVLDLTGKMKPKHLACAGCENHKCVNPAHAVALNRSQLQQRTAKLTQYGDSVTRSHKLAMHRRKRAVLTMELVQEMRNSGLTTRQAAEKYGISQGAAADAMAGRTWKDYSNPFSRLVRA